MQTCNRIGIRMDEPRMAALLARIPELKNPNSSPNNNAQEAVFETREVPAS
jgi:hypothetical protein